MEVFVQKKCCLCAEKFTPGDLGGVDHCHLTRKFTRAAQLERILYAWKITVFFVSVVVL